MGKELKLFVLNSHQGAIPVAAKTYGPIEV